MEGDVLGLQVNRSGPCPKTVSGTELSTSSPRSTCASTGPVTETRPLTRPSESVRSAVTDGGTHRVMVSSRAKIRV